MAYKGNYEFDEDDMVDEGVCTCCGEPFSMKTACRDSESGMCYSETFYPRYEDGEPVIADYDDYYLCANCDCDGKSLREQCEERDYIHLDEYGQKLLEGWRKFDDLKHINEFDVCRISEAEDKSFKQLCDLLDVGCVPLECLEYMK